ncbi:Sushi, von Willebrand factor type A, EGF and pentraxin domain-containing protein 1, partial [Geodia barretti]
AVGCGALTNPPNGVVDAPETVFPGVATYTCNPGYSLNGGSTRNCQSNAMWSGTAPTCTVVMCQVLLNPPNAIVQHPSGVEYLSTAEYSCNTGFTRASGDTER